MTKRDYNLIAQTIRKQLRDNDVNALAWHLCERLAENNPMFDKPRFLKACGVL